jgi:uroporphyrinogen decarboxylase
MTPFTPEPLILKPEDIDLLPDPDPPKTEWFQLLNRFNEICRKKGFSALLPSASIMSPLSSILGSTNLLKWIIVHPDAVHQIAKIVLLFNMKAAEITLERYGARNCSVTTLVPLESNSLISPEIFKEFCLPYIESLHRLYFDAGVRATMVHLCGDHEGNLPYWKELPLPERTIFSVGTEMDLKRTGDLLGERFILAGNISTTIIQFGAKEEIKEEVKRCLSQAKNRQGGFILMPACEWPPLAPPASLDAVKESLMEHGFY